MRVAEKQAFLEGVDTVLAGAGFSRPRRSQEWSKRDGHDRLWAHLNFGIGSIQLTVGVEYLDVRATWGDLPGGVFAASESPQDEWHSGDSPARVADCVRGVAETRLPQLCDRGAVVDRLLAHDVRLWPTFSFSHRLRLVAVLLINLGRSDEAIQFCRSIAGDDLSLDQIRPSFVEFREAIEAKLAN